jgi:hypothetical protein
MEASEIIVAALTAAATQLGKDTFSDAAKGAYANLKGLLQKKFRGQQEAQAALVKVESKPEEAQLQLKQAVIDTGADLVPEIVEAARSLLSVVNPQQASVSKYNTNISGNVQGFAQGDGATINMDLNSDKK